ncbi:NAD(P)H-dependent glycerol-3-phosphate dehydrogenase [Metamycoplasma canadense]|uniref:Glycerol-3-phosphate dehydrogenase n=1 Tax=Metamycoplasma canadense TaxID=29554 RepID=A0A077L709_9BACT|nr:NAD(P)H-dependent glycerol-3-phosphate dehydrogenase [Metamycoplasma canadense]BAP39591.1 glycerol-3-phosphate dehydrogenase [NAD(P)+] [Metamycoplasma canadense]
MKNKIAILGSGAMGTACASILEENGHDVIIYGIDQYELNDLKNGFNSKHFNNKLITNFKTTNVLNKAIENADYILIAIPTRFIPEVFNNLVDQIKNPTVIINVAKGFWPNSENFIHEGMKKIAKKNKNIKEIVSLIGPSFAIDIINKNITIVNAVSEKIFYAKKVKKIFSNSWFGVSINNDVIGAEIGSIFKNILAIASGMAEGLGYSTNTQTAILTFGLKEMKKYVHALKGNIETVYDLCGVGDLMLTGLSNKSRNYQFGKNFFNNSNNKNTTVEGLYALKYVYFQNKNKLKINLPLINAVYKIVYNKVNPQKIINNLIKKI